MKVLLLCRYPRLGASSRLRSYQYLPGLAQMGIEVEVSPLFSEAYLETFYRSGGNKHPGYLVKAYWQRLKQLVNVRKYDLLWLEKELFPWLPATAEWLLDRLGIPYLVDYDDAIFHRYDHSSSALLRFVLGRKIDRVMAGATMVTAGNDYLASRAKAAGARRVMILPTVVDVRRYQTKQVCETTPFTIGWIGSPTTVRYLQMLRESLSSLGGKREIRLVVIGAAMEPLPGIPVETLDWSEATEAELIRQFDVGVMPLFDELWERGKCGYKLIQYMACGLPVVASPVGVNREIVRHGVDGYLAASGQEWEKALMQLIDHPQLREEMGQMGRNKVEQHYSLSVMTPRLVSGIKQSVKYFGQNGDQ
jgi:glycosyltransferase involved in cell wall biosynthesis